MWMAAGKDGCRICRSVKMNVDEWVLSSDRENFDGFEDEGDDVDDDDVFLDAMFPAKEKEWIFGQSKQNYDAGNDEDDCDDNLMRTTKMIPTWGLRKNFRRIGWKYELNVVDDDDDEGNEDEDYVYNRDFVIGGQ